MHPFSTAGWYPILVFRDTSWEQSGDDWIPPPFIASQNAITLPELSIFITCVWAILIPRTVVKAYTENFPVPWGRFLFLLLSKCGHHYRRSPYLLDVLVPTEGVKAIWSSKASTLYCIFIVERWLWDVGWNYSHNFPRSLFRALIDPVHAAKTS